MLFNIRIACVAMTLIVAASNFLVLYPINDWLTWGAFPYPISFLVTELSNRFYGPKAARKVVYVGFIVAAILSVWISTPKIAVASLTAFLVSQMLDIFVFNKLRQGSWWQAPLVSSVLASLIDATIFWNLAFIGEGFPILSLAIGDTAVKIAVDLTMLLPFRIFLRNFKRTSSLR